MSKELCYYVWWCILSVYFMMCMAAVATIFKNPQFWPQINIFFVFFLTNPQRGWLITPEGCAPKGQEAPKGAGRKRNEATILA